MQKNSLTQYFLWLQIAVVAVFLGRAWQHLYWDAPYRVLLWDEDWMKPIVQGIFGISWEAYVTNLKVDQVIQNFIRITGIFYVFVALAAIFILRLKKMAVGMLWMGAISLAFLAMLYAKDRFFQIPQFLEFALQWSAPIFLIFYYQKQEFSTQLLFWMKIATALTFSCHGIYAIGLGNVQRATEFTQMTIGIIHTDEANAIMFLKVVGILDMIAGVLIFVPGRIGIFALAYCFFWGFITTMARIWANFYLEQFTTVLSQSLHESLYRFPHFIIPMVLFWYQNEQTRISQSLKTGGLLH